MDAKIVCLSLTVRPFPRRFGLYSVHILNELLLGGGLMEKHMYDVIFHLAESGEKAAMKEMIGFLLSKGRYTVTDRQAEIVLRYLNKLVEENDPEAMLSLGALYYTGFSGISQDYVKAMGYYEKAVELSGKKDTTAMNNLGYCHYYGRAGVVDYEKAYSCFAYAAMMGDANAMYKLGDMYYYGNHVDKDVNASFYWYSLAKRQEPEADADYQGFLVGSIAFRVGRAYLFGEGTDVDLIRALFELRTAEALFYQQILLGDEFSVGQLPKTQELIRTTQEELNKKINSTTT